MSGPAVRRWQNSVPMPCGGSFAAPAAGEEVFPGGHRGGCACDAAWVLIGEDGETAIGFRCDECRKREGLEPSTSPAPAGWEVAETGSEEVDGLSEAVAAGVICICGPGAGWDRLQTCLRCGLPLDRDSAWAKAIDAAPGPGSARPFEHPLLPEVQVFYGLKTRTPYVRIRTKNLAWERVEYMDSGSVGPFPVEPPPGLSAAQRRLVGEGWRFVRWGTSQTVALMVSPGDVQMWVYPGGSKSFGHPEYEIDPLTLANLDDGAAARQTREARADQFEDTDGRVQGVDRG